MIPSTEGNRRWIHRPEGSTWGDWGEDDQLGRLNLLTPDCRLKGVAEVREGLAFCLSLPLDYPGGTALSTRRHPPVLRPTLQGDLPNFNFPLLRHAQSSTDLISDDSVVLHLQYSTQWDTFAHVGQFFDVDGDGVPEPVYYNGFRADEHVKGPMHFDGAGQAVPTGLEGSYAAALGVETIAETCVQGRGVMIDAGHHFGRERVITGYDDLMRIIEKDDVVIEKGDLVCFRTGFDEVILEMERKPVASVLHNICATLDGRDARLLNWITDSGLVALISDNYAVENVPSHPGAGCCASLPLHEHCLFKLGVPLGELWLLSPLAAWLRSKRRSRFLLTAPPLRLPGAVGSPVTPVATV